LKPFSFSGRAGCVVDDKSKIYATAPKVAHMYEGELLEYPLLDDGSFVPSNTVIKHQAVGHEYALRVSFEKPYISPVPGSSIKGEIQLLMDGRPIINIPRDSSGNLNLKLPQIAVHIDGVGIQSKISYLGQSNNIVVSSTHNPFPITQIYSPQADPLPNVTMIGSRLQGYKASYIDLSRGKAEIELFYFGERTAPYISLRFNDRFSSMATTKILCFEDQANPRVSSPKIDTQAKGEFYYDVSVVPASLQSGHQQDIKISIVARNSRTGRVDTNPYQRVNIWAYPLIKPEIRSRSSSISQSGPGVRFLREPRGVFILEDTHNPKISKLQIKQAAENNGDNNGLELDLIKGRGTAYFNYGGTDQLPSTPLTFVVQPTNYAIDSAVSANGNVMPHRLEAKIEYPSKPADFIQGPAGNRQVISSSFLYRNWMDDDSLRYAVYTIKSLNIGGPKISLEPNVWFWILVSQISKLIFAGGLIWLLVRKHRNKYETSN